MLVKMVQPSNKGSFIWEFPKIRGLKIDPKSK